MQTASISHPACMFHRMSTHHPECPQRITAIEVQLKLMGLMKTLGKYDAPELSKNN